MLFNLIKLLVRPLFRVLFDVEHHGVAHVPESGAVIIAGNHPSYLDPLLLALPIKRPVRFMAWDALFKVPLLGQLIRAVGAFPVDIRKGRGEAAFQQALRVLESGDALGIFPEGQRSEQAALGELRTGVARLALATGAPIVPVTIGGASRAWPKWKLLPRPAKIIVRYHEPLRIDEAERAARHDDKEFQKQIMERLAVSINRSLKPAIRGADTIEQWYRQPPSNIRSYEWAPLIAALIATLASVQRGTFATARDGIWLPVLLYYVYLALDLTLIRPSRFAKWVRNSLPIWLIVFWHYWLVTALVLPAGERNECLVAAVLAAFFAFFYEDYFTLQKFVRGVVVSYYFSLALQLAWPHPLGTLVTVLGFIVSFCWRERVVYWRWIVAGAGLVLAAAVWTTAAAKLPLLAFAALALLVLAYLQAFASIAYDIRRAGNVALPD